ncbi:MAG TPA: lipase family protein [Paucimonas sp.]|nr:lipase family protein [Paucimonas sp.]
MRYLNMAPIVLAAAVVAGCGGGSAGPTIDNSMARGSLIANPPILVPIPQADGQAVTKLEPAVFAASLEAASPGSTLVTGTPKCAITTYYMKYATVGGAGEPTDATGAIMVPSGSDPACSGSRPVLLYAHGTVTEKNFNMANLRESEASRVAAMYAAQGFIVVAPNYAGYDVSSLTYHPYLNAEQQANDMIDGLRAARKAFASIGAQDSGKLFIAGYSQGGHVAMATQRAMQTNHATEFKVTALAGMSGPYAMTLLGDSIMGGTPNLGGTFFLPLIATSYQKSYGGIYGSTSDIYESLYASEIESLLPTTSTASALVAAGKLPQVALFASNSLPGPSSPQFAFGFGTGNLIKTSFRNAYLADLAQNPCNTAAGAVVSCTPASPMRKAILKNDLRNYVPTVPVFLCGGNADPTVFYPSTLATQAYFLSKGLPAAAVTVLDVDSAPTGATDPFAAAKVGFSQAKAKAVSASIAAGVDPAIGVASAYHGTLVPPFCKAAARGFFQSILAQAQ